ncbi:hypothetical protein EZ313_03190 [Ramlibacter henchirensis]|uniref:Uncharacterized protein n=1 Tax=Ramlibacter henchirensis TaxID=204072 RepID=A0A4Z0C394_9BURK|nr:hypothetical protein [Ramlibacter henchirensis]TFZ05681.1 hypothetical protein EZ313_03190 [Ramlibacter henchirensis]
MSTIDSLGRLPAVPAGVSPTRHLQQPHRPQQARSRRPDRLRDAPSKDVPITQSYRSVMPFPTGDVIRTTLLFVLPAISLRLDARLS